MLQTSLSHVGIRLRRHISVLIVLSLLVCSTLSTGESLPTLDKAVLRRQLEESLNKLSDEELDLGPGSEDSSNQIVEKLIDMAVRSAQERDLKAWDTKLAHEESNDKKEEATLSSSPRFAIHVGCSAFALACIAMCCGWNAKLDKRNHNSAVRKVARFNV